MKFYEYDLSTGQILRHHTRRLPPPPETGCGIAPTPEFDSEDYIAMTTGEGPVIMQQDPLGATWSKRQITADGVDEAVLSPLPDPCPVEIDGTLYQVIGGSLEVSANEPGSYVVMVKHPAHVRETWTIEAMP